MDGYISGDKLHLSTNNLSELNRLIEQAKEQSQQLTETLNSLAAYDLEITFSSK